MLLIKGSKGENVKVLQQFLKLSADGVFGHDTEKLVKQWQASNALSADGIVGPNTIAKMGLVFVEEEGEAFDEKYKNVIIQGSIFPDSLIKDHLIMHLTKEIVEEYLPALEQTMGDQPKGFKLLCTIMAQHEGYKKGTRSYRTNNPGNIGNTDRGSDKEILTLADGILLQRDYILKIVNGKHLAYPMEKKVTIKPYYSPEIAKHSKLYGMSPYLPGYEFVFTGQLDQFVKIYSTGARASNSYLSTIISYFNGQGIPINAQSKIQEMIVMS